VLVLRGRVFYRQGNYQRALEDYNGVIARNPSYYYAYCNRGYTYKKLGLNDKALSDFSTCRDLAANDAWQSEAELQIKNLRTTPGTDNRQDSTP
jgi:tetratricopeptide (TPR) repeat protein